MSEQSMGDLLEKSPHLCPTPLERDFYEDLAARLATAEVASEQRLDDFGGLAVDVPRGAALTLTLLEGPQIVTDRLPARRSGSRSRPARR